MGDEKGLRVEEGRFERKKSLKVARALEKKDFKNQKYGLISNTFKRANHEGFACILEGMPHVIERMLV